MTSWTRLNSFRSPTTMLTQAVYVFHMMLSRACTYSPLHYHPLIYYVLDIAQYIYILLFRGHRIYQK
ncbi:hypothetical protein B0H11DRAFT_2138266 [Mycena galericulata]|nr:hypothetical protein B0H11DRAFT_2138266 [Mycena galericulata]